MLYECKKVSSPLWWYYSMYKCVVNTVMKNSQVPLLFIFLLLLFLPHKSIHCKIISCVVGIIKKKIKKNPDYKLSQVISQLTY